MLPPRIQNLREFLLSENIIIALEYANLKKLNLPRKKKKAYKKHLVIRNKAASILMEEIIKIQNRLPKHNFEEGGISMSNPNRSVLVDNRERIIKLNTL